MSDDSSSTGATPRHGPRIPRDVLSLVGNTPVVEVKSISESHSCRLYLKLEGYNPTGSIKDRAALAIVREASRDGSLVPGGAIVESTSGNFGKALALIGAARGYRVILLVDEKLPPATMRFCSALGAELNSITDLPPGSDLQLERVARARATAAAVPDSFWPNQYANPVNPRIHEETTGAEVLADPGDIDVLVAAVSTGGHLTGVGRRLKRENPAAQVVAVDADGSRIFGGRRARYRMRGIGLSWCPENLDVNVVDLVQRVADAEAFLACRVLARSDGVFVGESGGAVVFASLVYAIRNPDRRILAIIPDGPEAYFDDGVFDDAWIARAVSPGLLRATYADLLAAASSPSWPPVPQSPRSGNS